MAMISHVLNTAVFGAPLATDAMDASLRRRTHTGNSSPLKRFSWDLRDTTLKTGAFFRPWEVACYLSEAIHVNGVPKTFMIEPAFIFTKSKIVLDFADVDPHFQAPCSTTWGGDD
jgi:hypothetical protein